MRQFILILFHLLRHAHYGSVLAASSGMPACTFFIPRAHWYHFLPTIIKYPATMLTTLRLTESSLCDKTTHVHASIISFHLFTCKLHILSCSKLCRQLRNAYGLPDWYSIQIHQQPIASRFRLHRVCQNPVSTGWLVTIRHSISSNTLQAHPHTARAADALRVGRWRTE